VWCGRGRNGPARIGISRPGLAICRSDRLQAIRQTLLAEFSSQRPTQCVEAFDGELQTLRDETAAARWLATAQALASHCPPASPEAIQRQLKQPGCVLFEGAQGVLLDEWRGFHPHTTWSSINTAAVERVAARFGIDATIEHFGVLRTYLTRHGVGPLPTRDESLDRVLPEPHNSGPGWQGGFRRGHPDAVLLRYAIEAVGQLSGLFISHLDAFKRGVSLKWCEGFLLESPLPAQPNFVTRLPLGAYKDLDHQISLTSLLQRARPKYDSKPISSAADFLERIAGVAKLPVVFGSYGQTCADVSEE
jgi:adenylosuccinate synthase